MEKDISTDKPVFFETRTIDPRKAFPLILMGFHRLFGLVSKLEHKNNPALEIRTVQIKKTLSKLKDSYRRGVVDYTVLMK